MSNPLDMWVGPKPLILLKNLESGDTGYDIIWKGKVLYSSSASKHSDALRAARRNRRWIMRKILEGTL
jgi:hypothetical protein